MNELTEKAAYELAELFETLSDPSRLKIISLLLDHEMNVTTLANNLTMSESAVSHQLSRLRFKHLVRTRREGRQVFYMLDDEHVSALFLEGIKHIGHIW
jgi:DNA-binding transcriptional ArsR family regulator